MCRHRRGTPYRGRKTLLFMTSKVGTKIYRKTLLASLKNNTAGHNQCCEIELSQLGNERVTDSLCNSIQAEAATVTKGSLQAKPRQVMEMHIAPHRIDKIKAATVKLTKLRKGCRAHRANVKARQQPELMLARVPERKPRESRKAAGSCEDPWLWRDYRIPLHA